MEHLPISRWLVNKIAEFLDAEDLLWKLSIYMDINFCCKGPVISIKKEPNPHPERDCNNKIGFLDRVIQSLKKVGKTEFLI